MSTRISWTNETWNPVTGCSHVSEGCRNCYAEATSLRYGWSAKPWTAANAAENVVLHPERLDAPSPWRKPRRVFVNSMSDLFHELIPDEYVRRIFEVMEANPRHTFQALTKRAERAATWPGPWPSNVWLGVSVEDRRNLHRLDGLRRSGAAVKWVSFEPLLEDLGDLDLSGLHWAVVGGESGLRFRPMEDSWARGIRDACVRAGLAFFFKQHSARYAGRLPWLVEEDGSRWKWEQYPDALTPPERLLEAAA